MILLRLLLVRVLPLFIIIIVLLGTVASSSLSSQQQQRVRSLAAAAEEIKTNGTHSVIFAMKSVCEQAVQAIAAVQQDYLALPEHYWPDMTTSAEVRSPPPSKQAGDLDAAVYMDVLQYISLPNQKTLDWVYDLHWMGGKPVLYVRDQTAEPFATIQEYRNASCSANNFYDCPDYLDEIIPRQESPEGYMQMAVLHVMAEQFYLYWHALLEEYQIVANPEMVRRVLNDIDQECGNAPTGDDLDRLLRIDMTPTVEYNMDDGSVKASLVVFNKWGGFYRKTITFPLDGTMSEDYESLFYYYLCYIY